MTNLKSKEYMSVNILRFEDDVLSSIEWATRILNLSAEPVTLKDQYGNEYTFRPCGYTLKPHRGGDSVYVNDVKVWSQWLGPRPEDITFIESLFDWQKRIFIGSPAAASVYGDYNVFAPIETDRNSSLFYWHCGPLEPKGSCYKLDSPEVYHGS